MAAFYTLLYVAPISHAELIAHDAEETAHQRYPNAWLKHIGDLELLELWHILDPDCDAATLLEDLVYATADGETIVAKVPAEFVKAVNGLSSSDLHLVAKNWQSSELMADWSDQDTVLVLEQLLAVCRQSADTGTPLLQIASL